MGSEARRPRGNSGCGADAKDESPKQSWLSCGTAARREGPRPEGGVGSENMGFTREDTTPVIWGWGLDQDAATHWSAGVVRPLPRISVADGPLCKHTPHGVLSLSLLSRRPSRRSPGCGRKRTDEGVCGSSGRTTNRTTGLWPLLSSHYRSDLGDGEWPERTSAVLFSGRGLPV